MDRGHQRIEREQGSKGSHVSLNVNVRRRTARSPEIQNLMPPPISPEERARLEAGRHTQPHAILGAHPLSVAGVDGVVVRAYHPDAVSTELLPREGDPEPMLACGGGIFALFLPGARLPMRYRFRFHFADGAVWERSDPYRYLPTLGDIDVYLFNEGTHRRLWQALGAHVREIDGEQGVSFAVWAPNAARVSVVGDFCAWDGRLFPMRSIGASGIFELFIPGISPGALYRYEILTADGHVRLKSDPFAQSTEHPPQNASRVVTSQFQWSDSEWLVARAAADPLRQPVSVYEVHLGSWRRVPEEGDRVLSYRELAPVLVEHVQRLGFTHIELLPIMEHPFDGSWGYQVTGYYAPSSRFGEPDDFRYFVDYCHRHGVGVLLDWVPAHFPKDDWALRRFDGTALYEHEDPRQGEHPDWGTLIFNYARREVKNFLVANALYWFNEFHVDGLRVDAVASMLYLDYSRQHGEWIANERGGRENLGAIELLRAVSEAVRLEHPGGLLIAEESTSFPGVTRSVGDDGLGFTFKWNMGWMHDTLAYFAHDPVHRKFHQDELTFAMVYEGSERFLMPLSHDEVVHGKGSLYGKMPGDPWRKLANLRLLLSYMFSRPGKKLLFMGSEIAQEREWDYRQSLDWHLLDQPARREFEQFVGALGRLYISWSPLWRRDPDVDGFAWIDCADRDQSVLAYRRMDGERQVVVVLNFTPVAREDYRVGVPDPGRYQVLLNSDEGRFGGGGVGPTANIDAEPIAMHGFAQSVVMTLPPLGAVLIAVEMESATNAA